MDNGNYFLGMAFGLAIGMSVALPGKYDLIVPLGKEDGRALKRGPVSDEAKARICGKINKAVQEFRKNPYFPDETAFL